MPFRRAPVTEKPHGDGAGVDDADIVPREEVQRLPQQRLVHERAPAVGQDGVHRAAREEGDEPDEGLQAVARHPDVPDLAGRPEVHQGGERVLDQLLQRVAELDIVHLDNDRWRSSSDSSEWQNSCTWTRSR